MTCIESPEVSGLSKDEPRNVHKPWCHIWTTEDFPCNCGASGYAAIELRDLLITRGAE